MTNVCMKFVKAGPNQSLIAERKMYKTNCIFRVNIYLLSANVLNRERSKFIPHNGYIDKCYTTPALLTN